MEDWIIKNEGTWVLAEGFNGFLGRVLHDKTLPSEGRVAMLRLLAYGAAQVNKDELKFLRRSKSHNFENASFCGGKITRYYYDIQYFKG
jgi:hypothetical protein